MIDYRYICARDNFSCAFTGADLTHDLEDRSDSVVRLFCQRVDPELEWTSSNVVLSGRGHSYFAKRKPLPSPNLPHAVFSGRLIMVVGSMFSEKTSTTRSLLNNYGYALGEYIWVKPDRDSRGGGVTTHNKDATRAMQNARAISWERPDKFVEELKRYPIVAIDEVQFFADRILYVIHQLLKAGCLVIANGLKLDYKRDLFGMTHYLLAED